jgi:hypothetical protein
MDATFKLFTDSNCQNVFKEIEIERESEDTNRTPGSLLLTPY